MENKTNNNQDKVSEKSNKSMNNNLIVVIRISGMVKVKGDIENSLDRLRLRRKYACVLIDGKNKSLMGILNKIKHYVAYGLISKDILIKLIKERAKSIEGDKRKTEVDVEKIANELIGGKKLEDFKLKSFFRLHPPRKGIKSKLIYPKGVLGNNKQDINKLIEKML